MNNTFNLKRFGMLFKKHTVEHGKTYALSTAVLAGILFITLLFLSYVNRGYLHAGDQVMIFVFGIAGPGSVFGSLIFADLSDRSKAIPALMLPASNFEKYLVGLIYSYFIFLIVYVSIFCLADVIVIDIGHKASADNKMINVFDPHDKPAVAYVIFTLFHAFIFWGAIFFKKMHFIKTTIAFFICLGLLIMINTFVLNGFLSAYTTFNTGMPFNQIVITQHDDFSILHPSDNMVTYGKVIFIIVILLFWITTYFRLKEKEV